MKDVDRRIEDLTKGMKSTEVERLPRKKGEIDWITIRVKDVEKQNDKEYKAHNEWKPGLWKAFDFRAIGAIKHSYLAALYL